MREALYYDETIESVMKDASIGRPMDDSTLEMRGRVIELLQNADSPLSFNQIHRLLFSAAYKKYHANANAIYRVVRKLKEDGKISAVENDKGTTVYEANQ